MKRSPLKSSFLALILLSSVCFSYSQNLNFRPYGADKGLRDNYVYTIEQDDNGFIWLGTGEGVCRFDGLNFVSDFPGDSLEAELVDRSFKDSKGRMWFGFRDGTIAVYDNKMTRVKPDSLHTGNIVGFTENSDGEILIGTQNKGIIVVKKDLRLSYISVENGQNFSSILMTDGGDLLAGTFEGLKVYRVSEEGTLTLQGSFDNLPSSRVLTISKRAGDSRYWAGFEDEGLFLVDFDDKNTSSARTVKIGADLGLEYAKVSGVVEDSEKNLWVSTNGDGVFQLIADQELQYNRVIKYTEANGMPSNYVSKVFNDYEGNFWFTTIGQGITVLKDQAFAFYNFGSVRFNDNILSIASDGDTYYLGGENMLLITDLSVGKPEIILDRQNGIPADKITALYNDGNGYIWMGTSRSGIYRLKTGSNVVSRFSFSANSLDNNVSSITGDRDYIWIGTYGGIMRIERNNLSYRMYTTQDRLPHNKIRSVFKDSKNRIWIATKAKGIYNVTDGMELTIDSRNELEFVAITEDKDGHLWAATDGDGVFEFATDSLTHYSAQEGLRSNYCYSIACDKSGKIWVGHRLGMSRIDTKKNAVFSYSVEQGMSADCNHNAIIENNSGNLVFGTSAGLVEYDPDRDNLNVLPPKLNILSLKISDQEYDFSEDINLKYNIYRIRIDFAGINMKNPEGVRYQYRIEGYDENWSEPSAIQFSNFRLNEGKYTFYLRACDAQGNCSEAPLLNINISLPFWKTWWFILLVASAMVITVHAIIKVRERQHKQLNEYLEKELNARTKEVQEQAEVIESKNRDITDSINYAQKIQASVLPSIQRLQGTFPGSFVFYQPRDIVSGDFYWYDKIGENRFIIVCADSTGHGVPGAFMSMIGTTLIKDICSRQAVKSPSEILMTLDKDIRDALNQNSEGEKANDGMDIIVAELDLRKKYLKVASAMRPIILYIDGQQIYVKGSRNSVGGKYEISSEKEFITEEFQLSQGDLIYMFSDGYTDQFGGPLGKKFKMVRLKNLIRDIHDKSMDEQYNYVKNNFNLWKEDLEQVDDVLFMGIRV